MNQDYKRSSKDFKAREKEIQDEIIELYNQQSEIDIHLARMNAARTLWHKLRNETPDYKATKESLKIVSK